jgi:crotonyl-CoA carboxylase/reductase
MQAILSQKKLSQFPAPGLGCVPKKMLACVIRPERYGKPVDAFSLEEVAVPRVGPGQVLVRIMAAGVNHNNVFAARGVPLDVVSYRQKKLGEREGFHIGGSDASGIVWAIGEGVTEVALGDEVILSCGVVSAASDETDTGCSTSYGIWGYELNWGAFAQYSLVQATQCHPKPKHLSWAEAACYMLTGATAYRMLYQWHPHTLDAGKVVLVWGARGGVGSMAIQLAVRAGSKVIAVVSDHDAGQWALRLGATGVINRRKFDHWGLDPHDPGSRDHCRQQMQAFEKECIEIAGARPDIILEHPGRDTFPTSLFICSHGGMVVTCGATTGYLADLDVRYLWMHQKRLQGSHFATIEQCRLFNELVRNKELDPLHGRSYAMEEIGAVHQLMADGKLPPGNHSILIGAGGI